MEDPLRPFKHTPPTQRPAETAREDELILMNANCKIKNVAISSLGSHLAALEEMNLKHSPHRCQLKDSSSEMQHLAFPSSQEAVLPFQCKCSMKVVIPQLPDSIPSHRHKSASFRRRRDNLLNTPSCNIRFFLPAWFHWYIPIWVLL